MQVYLTITFVAICRQLRFLVSKSDSSLIIALKLLTHCDMVKVSYVVLDLLVPLKM